MGKVTINLTRCISRLPLLSLVAFLIVDSVIADEHRATVSDHAIVTPSKSSTLRNGFRFDWKSDSKIFSSSPVELPRRSRVTRSHLPLRQITLVGGDRFVGEFLEWEPDFASFRLLGGQLIRVPRSALAVLANPPGEVDLLVESIESDSLDQSKSHLEKIAGQTQPTGGRRSPIVNSSSGYRREFAPPLTAARIEFSFQTFVSELSTSRGEWQLEILDNAGRRSNVIIRADADRTISVIGVPSGTDATTQTFKLLHGEHSFISLIESERIRLIVDESILASFTLSKSSLHAIQFRASDRAASKGLRVSELHVRSLVPVEPDERVIDSPADNDLIRLASGDELFGRLTELTRSSVEIEAFDKKQRFPWTALTAVVWKQPMMQLQQVSRPTKGIVSTIDMQPFVDRPDCEPEHWTATINRIDAEHLFVSHPVVGELIIPWSEVRRIVPQFFGQTLLIDGRQFHLGNSIRSDFHRQLPDGTENHAGFRLYEVPRAPVFVSLEIAELEAAGPTAPPASPFLTELRAGRLVTEVFVNDQRIGNLNSLIRFKVLHENPERVRLAVPGGILKTGENSIRLRQKPLNDSGREFDDCEVGNIRLEFDMTH